MVFNFGRRNLQMAMTEQLTELKKEALAKIEATTTLNN